MNTFEQPTLFGPADTIDRATGEPTIGGPTMHVLRGTTMPGGAEAAAGVGARPGPRNPAGAFHNGFPPLVALGARAYAQGLSDGMERHAELDPIALPAVLVHALQCPAPPPSLHAALHQIYAGARIVGAQLSPNGDSVSAILKGPTP